jgi:hypothetical protein
MRVMPKNFTGFHCGGFQLSTHPELGTVAGVMEWKDGQQVRLHVPKRDFSSGGLYRQLTKGVKPTMRARVIQAPLSPVEKIHNSNDRHAIADLNDRLVGKVT